MLLTLSGIRECCQVHIGCCYVLPSVPRFARRLSANKVRMALHGVLNDDVHPVKLLCTKGHPRLRLKCCDYFRSEQMMQGVLSLRLNLRVSFVLRMDIPWVSSLVLHSVKTQP